MRTVVKLNRNNLFVPASCFVCGQQFHPGTLTANVMDGERATGDLMCERCLRRGLAAAREALVQQAAVHEEQARLLRRLAAGHIELPNYEDFRNTAQEMQRRYADFEA